MNETINTNKLILTSGDAKLFVLKYGQQSASSCSPFPRVRGADLDPGLAALDVSTRRPVILPRVVQLPVILRRLVTSPDRGARRALRGRL